MDSVIIRRWRVGSGDDVDVRIAGDAYVSAAHCTVAQCADGTFHIRDEGSMNGTYIVAADGARQSAWAWTQIRPGETLVVGRTQIPWRPGA